ncbi:MAG: lipase maturation factor family protein [Acidobacteria bacterium]|nr:lipase maturation factor family protein [Acidobacteriota bacterium]MBI3264141.1 lipase maturation factor family protein [Acidobacteriota bacterium]
MIDRVGSPPSSPLMIFDGDCGFCRRWIARWKELTGGCVRYLPFQDPDIAAAFPELPRERFQQAVQLIEPDGWVFGGAEAVFRALAHVPEKRWLLSAYQHVPGVAPVAERTYRLIARHRPAAATLTDLLWGRELAPTYEWAVWLFIRLLGLIYLVAFVSFWTQASGLIGSRGIVPVHDSLEAFRTWMAQAGIGLDRYRWFPTLFWLNTSDAFLQGVCGAGALLSALLVLGAAPAPILVLLWIGYLSLMVVAGEFLAFQWDVLLLEMGLLAIFLAPPQLRSRRARPTAAVLWLLWFLLFRLMFSSGVVKLMSGDPTWRDLTALTFHYETQPLPTWIGWYAHQLPPTFQVASAAMMFGIELVAPFLIFAPRRLRLIAGVALLALQVLIDLTGNYGFFGWQIAALCLLLVDDATFRRLGRSAFLRAGSATPLTAGPSTGLRAGRWPRWLVNPVVVVLATASFAEMAATLQTPIDAIPPVGVLRELIAPLRSVNSYGLFAIMTTSRPEIIVEGSRDGSTWEPYEFRYKPGDPSRQPSFVAPHQPRLDWQLWFAALGRCVDNQWFINFSVRLLEGSPDVVALLARNPFPGEPPRQIRTVVYDYHFTDRQTKRTQGTWWWREQKGPYCPGLPRRE